MVKKIDTAEVKLWGDTVGAVSWIEKQDVAVFEYDREFLKKGLDVSPIHMPLSDASKGDAIFSFPSLNKNTFLGLPGLLADVLPDKFGNRIIDAWLARNGRDVASFSPVERLCYAGKRAMGALEFSPLIMKNVGSSVPVEISELVVLAQDILSTRSALDVKFSNVEKENSDAIVDIIRVGTSAGGARSKAVIGINDDGHVISGQAGIPKSYDYWIIKFDGVTDLELGEPRGYGRIEYAYYLMAKAAGIKTMECRLLEENRRAHFMTKRFDRVNNSKLHMQSLCGIAHYDFNRAGEYAYEQAFVVMQKLNLTKVELAEQYRRMVFNVVAKNLDDHTKNISFLMRPDGKWYLTPAYDVTYAHNPKDLWTNKHQMSLQGKRDNISKQDFIWVAEEFGIVGYQAIIDDVLNAIERWPQFAEEAGINQAVTADIDSWIKTKNLES